MQKFIPLLIIPLLVSCGEKKVQFTEEQLSNRRFPGYCIKNVEFFENENSKFARIEMPYYQWWNDRVIQQEISVVSREWYDTQEQIEFCQADDPRMKSSNK